MELSEEPMRTGPRHRSSYRWQVVAMLWLVCFFNYADRQAISAVFPLLKEEFGFDSFQLGLIGSAFMWVYAAGAPFAGFIADRVKRVHLILGGCIFWSFVTVSTAWCSKLWHFVTVRALEGFGETFYFPASMSLTADYHGPQTRGRAFALHQSSVYAGTILGSWLGAVLGERYGWRVGFFAFGLAGMVVGAILYCFLREPERGAAERAEAEGNATLTAHHSPLQTAATPSGSAPQGIADTAAILWKRPAIPLLMLAFLGANFVATIFLSWAPTFLHDKFGYKLGAAGLNGTLFIHLASALAVPLAGILADRLAQRFPAGRVLVQAAGLLVGSVFVAMVGLCSTTGVLIAAMTAFGFCKGFYDSGIFASLFDQVEPRARASAAGLMNTVGWGGGALGPVFFGWVTNAAAKQAELAATASGATAELAAAAIKAAEVEAMSRSIAAGGVVYLVCAGILFAAYLLARRPSPASSD
jgi:MFS family permease